MAAWSGKRSGQGWQELPGALRATVQGVLLLVGLCAVAFGFAGFVGQYDRAGAYLSAPLCGAAAATDGECVLRETGRVTDKWVDQGGEGAGTSYRVDVARASAPTRTFDLDQAFYDDVQPGALVDLKLWKGQVVRISHDGHQQDDRHVSWPAMIPHALLIGLGTVAVIYGLLGPRRKWSGMPAFWGVVVVVGALVGSVVLVDLQWSFPVTLVLAVGAWLLMTAVTASLVQEVAGPGGRAGDRQVPQGRPVPSSA